jgi:hypothetical protein
VFLAAADPESSGNLLYVLFGGAGLAFLSGVYRLVKDYQTARDKKKSNTLNDLDRWRRRTDDAREWSDIQLSWYRDWSGRLEYELTRRGFPLPEKAPYPVRPPDSAEE